jgi:hypothetical protein
MMLSGDTHIFFVLSLRRFLGAGKLLGSLAVKKSKDR